MVTKASSKASKAGSKAGEASAGLSAPLSVASVRATEERLLADRRHANELIDLLAASASAADVSVRLAATQACRALFVAWAEAGSLPLGAEEAAAEPADEAEARQASALEAYREWLRDKYDRFVAALGSQLGAAAESPELRVLALDSLMLLASAEVRLARPGAACPYYAALGASRGALGAGMLAMASAKAALPPPLLERIARAHAFKLDVGLHLLRHVQRLARPQAAAADGGGGERAERLLQLLLLVTPPAEDVLPEEAPLLVPPAQDPAGWPAPARSLLQRKRHVKEFCGAWRALLALPLPARAHRRVLAALPEAVLPHVPRPLRYADLLSSGYSRGGEMRPRCGRDVAETRAYVAEIRAGLLCGVAAPPSQ